VNTLLYRKIMDGTLLVTIVLMVLATTGLLFYQDQQDTNPVSSTRKTTPPPPSYAVCAKEPGNQLSESSYLYGPLEDAKSGVLRICESKDGWRVADAPDRTIAPIKLASASGATKVADSDLKRAVLAAHTTADAECSAKGPRSSVKVQPGLYSSGTFAVSTPNNCYGAEYRTSVLYTKTASGWQVAEDTNDVPGPGLFLCSTISDHKVPLLLLLQTGNTNCWTADGRLKDLVSGTVY
jgi:hypothetical protein